MKKDKEQEYLIHFTSFYHFKKIINDGYIIPNSCDNLVEPVNSRIVNGIFMDDAGSYNVSWWTDSTSPKGHGLESSCVDKAEFGFILPKDDRFTYWATWAHKNGIKKRWFKAITKGMNYTSWYITHDPISITDCMIIGNGDNFDAIYADVQFGKSKRKRTCLSRQEHDKPRHDN